MPPPQRLMADILYDTQVIKSCCGVGHGTFEVSKHISRLYKFPGHPENSSNDALNWASVGMELPTEYISFRTVYRGLTQHQISRIPGYKPIFSR